MARRFVPMEQRKISITLSVPYQWWMLAKKGGGKVLTDAIGLGLWAKNVNMNHITLLKLKQDYEDKIVKLQEIIESK